MPIALISIIVIIMVIIITGVLTILHENWNDQMSVIDFWNKNYNHLGIFEKSEKGLEKLKEFIVDCKFERHDFYEFFYYSYSGFYRGKKPGFFKRLKFKKVSSLLYFFMTTKEKVMSVIPEGAEIIKIINKNYFYYKIDDKIFLAQKLPPDSNFSILEVKQ